ncbi:hypothetical protein JG688_00016215 [Phytophthora aleatoria]|uniref:Cytochrome P450 n=1 Tax=Phytophthora aleatoria TaxID=2496075 RepID=A0A8J5I8R8_9STRA|nr:hypothetical protein JG688_00016215 [Phytophthora aleatoria]
MSGPPILLLNVGDEKKLKENVRVIDGHVMGIIPDAIERRRLRVEVKKASRPAALADKGIVSIVLDNIESRGMPVERNIAVASIIAGRDTTADCMGWLFHLLGERGKIPKFSTDKHYTPTVEDINKVPYLEACIRELLRLYPPGPLITAHCIKDTVFPDGTFVPANTDISIALFSCRRLASVWGEDALEFKPKRFIDNETIPMTATKFAALSAGPRICLSKPTTCHCWLNSSLFNLSKSRGTSLSYHGPRPAPRHATFTPAQGTGFYFRPCRDANDEIVSEYFRCRCGTVRKQTRRNGYSSLMQHVRREHPDYEAVMLTASTDETDSLLNYVRRSALNVFGWLDWIIKNGLPLHFCENPAARR